MSNLADNNAIRLLEHSRAAQETADTRNNVQLFILYPLKCSQPFNLTLKLMMPHPPPPCPFSYLLYYSPQDGEILSI